MKTAGQKQGEKYQDDEEQVEDISELIIEEIRNMWRQDDLSMRSSKAEKKSSNKRKSTNSSSSNFWKKRNGSKLIGHKKSQGEQHSFPLLIYL